MAGNDYETVLKRVAGFGQEHLFRFWPELSDAERAELLADIENVRLDPLPGLIESHVKHRAAMRLSGRIEPVDMLPARADDKRAAHYAAATNRGEALISQGRVAALTVAGGQGTRLGYTGPKGCFEISPVRNKTLFQLFAESILAVRKRYNAPVDWYVMTSPGNDAQTREYFARNGYFGLEEDDVRFFVQGVMPALGFDGKILLEEKHRLALSPDGHGGTLLALARSGALEDMKRRGVALISYFQVDNPLVRVIDPLFLGLHDLGGSEMSSKAIPKVDDLERVGNFVRIDGKVRVIEYSDLPEKLAHRKNDRGLRAFDAGSMAVHVMSVSFVERLTGDEKSFGLPWHRADKKVSCIDVGTGRRIEPAEPNAVKLEAFIFDAVPLARNPLVYQTVRSEEFSPLKNATGVDSPETARRGMVFRAANWLDEAGVEVPRRADGTPDAVIEIDPLFAVDVETLKARRREIPPIRAGEVVYVT